MCLKHVAERTLKLYTRRFIANLRMGNTKTCDIHPNDDNFTDQQNIRKCRVEQWVKVGEKNTLFFIEFDGCLECLKGTTFDRLEARGISVQTKWVTDVWNTGKTGKRYTTKMDLPTFQTHLAQEKVKEQEAEILKLRAGVTK